jgi:hypothetical protein
MTRRRCRVVVTNRRRNFVMAGSFAPVIDRF